jgi:hypothetical protein
VFRVRSIQFHEVQKSKACGLYNRKEMDRITTFPKERTTREGNEEGKGIKATNKNAREE